MELEGTVQNGMIVPDEPNQLVEGDRVLILTNKPRSNEQLSPLAQRLLKLAGTAAGLPSDMARNHDHYLHGAPKQ
ncbi:MAG: hypothetical protein ACJ8C4_12535 [Gemmataceae bacterium]